MYQAAFPVAFGARRAVLDLGYCYYLLATQLRSNGGGGFKSVGGGARPLKARSRAILKRYIMLRMRKSRFMPVQAFAYFLAVLYEYGLEAVARHCQKKRRPTAEARATNLTRLAKDYVISNRRAPALRRHSLVEYRIVFRHCQR